ncbi:GTPase-activating protein GYP1 [Vairimorpha necatrix]|uniref:GTPase-activating protein GYP1 n=1 Tax=Vairimorpha necatrix TaxID=6039 RepID=A0AAX4JB39_9MICR
MTNKSKLQRILSHRIIDEVKLRKFIKKSRSIFGPDIWSLLLKNGSYEEYLTLLNMSFNNNVLFNNDISFKDNDSYDFSLAFNGNILDFIKKNNLPFHNKIPIDKKILHQIQIDIKRLNTNYTLVKGKDISKSYINILLLISHKRYKLGYVQGMADFLVPFVLNCPEYQAYFLYLDFIKKIEFNIINLQGNLILRFREEMENIDPVLCDYLHEIGLEFHVFSFRWFNCIFFREFQYQDYMKIFTNILSYKDINSILVYIGVAILNLLRKDILTKTYNDNVLMIQDMSNNQTIVVDNLLIIANKLYKHNKKNNLKN